MEEQFQRIEFTGMFPELMLFLGVRLTVGTKSSIKSRELFAKLWQLSKIQSE
jgi:hypothetical protein